MENDAEHEGAGRHVYVARIDVLETGCRVILSDGSELRGLSAVRSELEASGAGRFSLAGYMKAGARIH